MSVRRVFAGAVMAASVAAGGATVARAQAQVPAGPPAAGQPAVVTLLSAGSEPRRPLRYVVAAPSKMPIDISMQMTMAMTVGEMSAPAMEMPVIRMGADFDVVSAVPGGDIAFTFGYTGIAVDGNNPMFAEIGGMSDELKTVRGEMTMSDRGVMRTVKFDLDKISNPQIKQMMASSGLENLSAPLPAEAVGIGARWEVRQTLIANGIETHQKTIYELVGLDAQSATMAVSGETSGPAQKFDAPGMPPGASARILGMTGKSDGKMVLRNGALMPLGDMNVTTNMQMELTLEGQSQQMSTSTSIKIGVTAARR
ncbi:MAG: hypothetical protein M3R55_09195 [Acidobacteriota bacterium]|nr:hypothetical protein [Acidobacteriota bacterium]